MEAAPRSGSADPIDVPHKCWRTDQRLVVDPRENLHPTLALRVTVQFTPTPHPMCFHTTRMPTPRSWARFDRSQLIHLLTRRACASCPAFPARAMTMILLYFIIFSHVPGDEENSRCRIPDNAWQRQGAPCRVRRESLIVFLSWTSRRTGAGLSLAGRRRHSSIHSSPLAD